MTSTFVSLPRAAVLSFAIAALTSSVATAQTPAVAPPAAVTAQTNYLGSSAFARMVQGRDVWITTSDGMRHKGRVVELSLTAMTVASNIIKTVPFDQVVKVESASNKPRNGVIKGTLIGFGAGFGGMALVLASCWGDECEPNLGPAFLFGGIGAGVGAVVGMLIQQRPPERGRPL